MYYVEIYNDQLCKVLYNTAEEISSMVDNYVAKQFKLEIMLLKRLITYIFDDFIQYTESTSRCETGYTFFLHELKRDVVGVKQTSPGKDEICYTMIKNVS